MDFSSFFTLIQTIILLLIVIGIANISLRYLNKHMKKHNRLIKVIERVSISNNSSIAIVEICGDYYLMSFTSADNRILKKLEKEKMEDIIKEIKNNKDLTIDKNLLSNILGMREKN